MTPKILFNQARESSLLRVYETHLLCQFRKRSIMDGFRKLTGHCSGLLALGVEQLFAV